MSGIDNRVVGQDEQTAANMLYQFVEVAAGKVGTADAALKQHIPREHAVVCRAIVHQAARRVSRHMDGFQFRIAEGDDVAVVQVSTLLSSCLLICIRLILDIWPFLFRQKLTFLHIQVDVDNAISSFLFVYSVDFM